MVRHPFLVVAAASALSVKPVSAQQATVVSPAPAAVALTVYRAPYARTMIDLRYLAGFALVTETRRVQVPRGPAVVRFEGVADGIVPVSAVVEGLPGGVVEKNRDARLLSPASLVDGTLGRLVTLTRSDKSSGRQVSEQATIVAGPSPGVVLRTSAGVEALRCSGLPEGLQFDGVPAGLASKPVLSVATRSPSARTVTVRLSYLASGFDWRASYVANLRADGRALDLFAWLTLANGNPETFVHAEVNAVAGRLNRVLTPTLAAAIAPLRLSCFPLGTTTSDLREKRFSPAEEIIVSAARALDPPMIVVLPAPAPPSPPPPEDLGDLKLYRVPERVTVSARGQKQVALLARATVPFERRYRFSVYPGQLIEAAPASVMLFLRNRKDAGLGLPLPAGTTALYATTRGGGRLLLGEGALDDRTEGETVRIRAGNSSQVQIQQMLTSRGEALLKASNANPFPVDLDVAIGAAGQDIKTDDDALSRTDGLATWSRRLPPGGSAQLRYRF